MNIQPNRLRPTTTALAMLRRGWAIVTPDRKYRLVVGKIKFGVFNDETSELIKSFDKTTDGFEQMMNEVVNPPF